MFGLKSWTTGFAAVAALLAVGTAANAADVRVAVAANFQKPMEALVEPFKKEVGHDLKLSFGATGQFYSQIVAGAPFDVFLAADTATPEKLEKEGKAVMGTRSLYAIGRLALWSADANKVKGDGMALIKGGAFNKLAIADPPVAPYGVAAQQALTKAGLWDAVQPKLVKGTSIAQTLQFADTGNADMAFVALSQVLDPAMKGKGSHWLVPADQHAPIEQSAILLLPAADNVGARTFLAFLKGPTAKKVIEDFGYAFPGAK